MTIFPNNKATLKRKLNVLSKSYEKESKVFHARVAELKQQFNLKPGQEREVDFGIIIPADRSLRKYCDIINSDQELNDLRSRIDTIILDGCVEIFQELESRKTYIPGYDLDEFIEDPEENIQEIKELMQGFGGYEHIHFIGEKIALEIPARTFLPKDRPLKRAIIYWLKTVKEFSMWD